MPLVLFNAEITPDKRQRELGFEGCDSVPGIRVEIDRPAATRIKGLSEKGETVEFECSGLLARVVQHEWDHLRGKLFMDRMSPETFASVQERLR
jgi:peptide deformylase